MLVIHLRLVMVEMMLVSLLHMIPVVHPKSGAATGVGITERFPLGTYIQVNDEIMRVSDASLVGTNKLVVLRGVFSSPVGIHSDTSLVKKD